MTSIFRSLKLSLKAFLETAPIISDFYLYLLFPNRGNWYRGVYSTYSDASDAIDSRFTHGYDTPDVHPEKDKDLETLRPYDLPLLAPLQTALENSVRVIDLGGGVGIHYYAFRKALNFPKGLTWTVCDVPAAIELGQELAACKDENHKNLSFTTDLQTAKHADILITNGALQYIEPSLVTLIHQLLTRPKHIFINYVPCSPGETFFTVQNLGVTRCVYKIQNRRELIYTLEQLGYQLQESWQDSRTCRIPFHSGRFADGYYGFYFSLKDNNQPKS